MSNFSYEGSVDKTIRSWAVKLKNFQSKFLTFEQEATELAGLQAENILTLQTDLDTAETNITNLTSRVNLVRHLVAFGVTNNDTVQSTTSGALVSVTQSNVSVAVEVGDVVEIINHSEVSHSSSGGQIIWNLRRDTTALLTADRRIFAPSASTSGQTDEISTSFIETIGTAGTVTYRIAIRTTAGTVYVVPRVTTVKVFRLA